MTGTLPHGWAKTTLGEIGRYLNGRAFKSHEWSDSGRMIIRIQDLTGSGNSPNHYSGDVEPRYEVRTGDLLISWAATLGAFIWRGPDAVLNQHIFKVESHIDQGFHFWLVTGILDQLRGQAHGSGMVHITKGNFDATPVALPPFAEQRRVVEAVEQHLSDLDAAVSGMERARANVRRFVDSSIATLMHPRADSPLVPLRELGALKGGVTKGQKRRPGEPTRAVPYLRVANVQRGRLELRDMRTIEATEREIRELRLLPGDVLFNEGGDRDKLGRGWVWNGELDECIHQNHVFRARLDTSLVEPRFVSHYANSYGQRYFLDHGTQTTNLASISMTKLGALPIPLPPLDEQRAILSEIDERLAVAHRTAADIDVQLARAARLRQAILHRAFTGRLVAQDPADEPASVLLERIRSGSNQRTTAAPRGRRSSRATLSR